MRTFFAILLLLALEKSYSWEYLFLGGDWEPGGIEGGKYRPEEYSFGFHVSHWERYYQQRPIFLNYGLGEGFRVNNNGAEFYLHAQTSAVLGFLAVGTGFGPVLRTQSQKSIDFELSVWTGTFFLVTLRFPSTVQFSDNSEKRNPVLGVTLTLPAKYPY